MAQPAEVLPRDYRVVAAVAKVLGVEVEDKRAVAMLAEFLRTDISNTLKESFSIASSRGRPEIGVEDVKLATDFRETRSSQLHVDPQDMAKLRDKMNGSEFPVMPDNVGHSCVILPSDDHCITWRNYSFAKRPTPNPQ